MTARGRANPRYAKSTARVRLRNRLKAEGRGCWICRAFGRPDAIDYSLPARHPRAFEVDDLVPVSRGGNPVDYGNVDAAHRECNIWRGNRPVWEVLAIAKTARGGTLCGKNGQQEPEDDPVSRDW